MRDRQASRSRRSPRGGRPRWIPGKMFFLCRREKMDMMNAFAFSMGMGWLPTKNHNCIILHLLCHWQIVVSLFFRLSPSSLDTIILFYFSCFIYSHPLGPRFSFSTLTFLFISVSLSFCSLFYVYYYSSLAFLLFFSQKRVSRQSRQNGVWLGERKKKTRKREKKIDGITHR